MSEETKNTLEEIQTEVTVIMGGLILAETWLKEGWDGTLEKATHVMPDLTKTVTAARKAMERIFELAGDTMDRAT